MARLPNIAIINQAPAEAFAGRSKFESGSKYFYNLIPLHNLDPFSGTPGSDEQRETGGGK